MIRPRATAAMILGLTVLMAACTDDAGGEAPTRSTAESSSVTTTSGPSEIEIPAQGILKFEPGEIYVASRFWEPVSFTVDEGGVWWARGATATWVHAEYHQGGESPWDLDLSVLAPDPGRATEALVSDIVEDDWIRVIADPRTVTVAGHDGLVLDVVGLDVPSSERTDSCTDREDRGSSRFFQLDTGFHLMRESEADAVVGGWSFGVRSCRAARIWVVNVDGSSIVIIAATYSEELFDRLIPVAEDLLAGLEFP